MTKTTLNIIVIVFIFIASIMNGTSEASAWPSELLEDDYNVSTRTISTIKEISKNFLILEFSGGLISVGKTELFNRGTKIDIRTLKSDGKIRYVCLSGTDTCVKSVSF